MAKMRCRTRSACSCPRKDELEGTKLEGMSWSSVRKPYKEKATQKHQLLVISYSHLTGVYAL